MVPFIKALKDGNNRTSNDPGLAAECFIIDFHCVRVEEDFCDKEKCIPNACVELMSNSKLNRNRAVLGSTGVPRSQAILAATIPNLRVCHQSQPPVQFD